MTFFEDPLEIINLCIEEKDYSFANILIENLINNISDDNKDVIECIVPYISLIYLIKNIDVSTNTLLFLSKYDNIICKYITKRHIIKNLNVTYDEILKTKMSFYRANGEYLRMIEFLPDGSIFPIVHDNESFWNVQNGILFLYHRDGHITTKFLTYVENDTNFCFVGLLEDGKTVHILEKI